MLVKGAPGDKVEISISQTGFLGTENNFVFTERSSIIFGWLYWQ